MKLNVISVFRTINFIKLQGIHFYIIVDINDSGNRGVKIGTHVNLRKSHLPDLAISRYLEYNNLDSYPSLYWFLEGKLIEARSI